MIKRIKLSRGDVLVVTDPDGNNLLFAALMVDDHCFDDNQLLLKLITEKTGTNQSGAAHRTIAKLLDPDFCD
jgi:hypothetical protein